MEKPDWYEGKLNMNDVRYFFALWGLYFRQLFGMK